MYRDLNKNIQTRSDEDLNMRSIAPKGKGIDMLTVNRVT